MDITLTSHGGANGVTGSCHELHIDSDYSLLVDCGLFQGEDAKHIKNQWQIAFPINTIKALLITHCHIDHVGRIPALLAAGFTGPIYCTKSTALLLPSVIEDALKVGVTRNKTLVKAVLSRLKKQLIGVDYGVWTCVVREAKPHARMQDLIPHKTPDQSPRIKFKPAGHILGSAYIEIDITKNNKKQRIVFSGDLGAPYTPLLPAPKSPYKADWLILESTYGDRLHQGRATRVQRLKGIIDRSLQDGGAILIPAFSIGRTQELLYELEEIIHQSGARHLHCAQRKCLAPSSIPIIVDSPLAAHFTDLYRQLKPEWDKEAKNRLKAGRHPLSFKQLITIDSHEQHQALVTRLKHSNEPTIIIAASGMCTGGRIMNYLEALLGNKQTDVLFVGYQGKGTTGREIQEYGPQGGYVYINDKRIDIKAQIHTLSGYSAHADQRDLVNFVKRIKHKPQRITLVHGDREAKEALGRLVSDGGVR